MKGAKYIPMLETGEAIADYINDPQDIRKLKQVEVLSRETANKAKQELIRMGEYNG